MARQVGKIMQIKFARKMQEAIAERDRERAEAEAACHIATEIQNAGPTCPSDGERDGSGGDDEDNGHDKLDGDATDETTAGESDDGEQPAQRRVGGSDSKLDGDATHEATPGESENGATDETASGESDNGATDETAPTESYHDDWPARPGVHSGRDDGLDHVDQVEYVEEEEEATTVVRAMEWDDLEIKEQNELQDAWQPVLWAIEASRVVEQYGYQNVQAAIMSYLTLHFPAKANIWMNGDGEKLGFSPPTSASTNPNKAHRILRQQAMQELHKLNQQHLSGPFGMAPGPRVTLSRARAGAPSPAPLR